MENAFGRIFFGSPLLILAVVAVYHLAVLWMLWRIARALERPPK
jgi:hypothetical protein